MRRQPWPRSPVRVQQPVSTHPVPSPGARLSGPSGVRPLRCPVAWVHRPGSGVRPSGVHPSGVQPSGVRPRPSGRVRLVPYQAVALGTGRCGKTTRTMGTGPGPLWAAPSSSGSGRRPSRPGPRRRRRGHPWSAGLSVADPGRVGWGRRPGLTLASRAGQAGMPSARCRRLRCGHGRKPQRKVAAPGREAAVLGLGGRPPCVVVVAPAARVDGPGGTDGLAGGDGRAAPARPRQPASVPGLLPTAL
jgi:hypothetical protein